MELMNIRIAAYSWTMVVLLTSHIICVDSQQLQRTNTQEAHTHARKDVYNVGNVEKDSITTLHSSRYIGEMKSRQGRRVHQDLFIHAKARGFNYDLKKVANEFQILGHPRTIRVQHTDIGAGVGNSSDYVITDVSPLQIDNDDIVTISFRSANPSSDDFIAAYSPASVNIQETSPVKWGYCDGNASYIPNGVGSLTFNFTNLRDNIAFYYFTAGSYDAYDNPDLSDTTSQSKYDEFVTFNNDNQPLRPRVVASQNANDTTSLQLLWSSKNSASPTLKWGIQSGMYTYTTVATTSSIGKTEMCGAPANSSGWRDLGAIHTATFVDIRSLGIDYVYYIFGDENTGDYSKEYRLKIPQLPSQTSGKSTTIILYDDLGRGSLDQSYTWNEYGRPAVYTSMAVAHELNEGSIDAIYHGGDISYATGYMAVWDFYLDMMGPVAGKTLYLTTVGNHESDFPDTASYYQGTDSGGECGVPVTKLIPMPFPAKTNSPWWSYDVGLVHLIGMSSEHNFTTGSPQWQWLQHDLQSVDKTITPWIIFGAHRAMYINSNYVTGPYEQCETPYQPCSSEIVPSPSDSATMDLMITHVEPLLKEYKVDIGFYGHNHAVQRDAAVYNRTVLQKATQTGPNTYKHVDPPATIHFVIGTAGAMFTKNALDPQPECNSLTFYEYGYVKATASDQYTLKWEWINSESGQSVDVVYIYRSQPDSDASTYHFNLATIFAIVFGTIAAAAVIIFVAYVYGCIQITKWISNSSSQPTVTISPIHEYTPPVPIVQATVVDDGQRHTTSLLGTK